MSEASKRAKQKWSQNNPDKIKAYAKAGLKKWRTTHPDEYKAQNRRNARTFIEWRRISTIFLRILL